MSGAKVALKGTDLVTRTDKAGNFVIADAGIRKGVHLTVSHNGLRQNLYINQFSMYEQPQEPKIDPTRAFGDSVDALAVILEPENK